MLSPKRQWQQSKQSRRLHTPFQHEWNNSDQYRSLLDQHSKCPHPVMTPHPQPTHRKPFINTQEQEQLDKPRTVSVFCFSIEFYMTVNRVNLRIWKVVHIQSGDHVWLLGRLVQHRDCYGGRRHPIRGPPVQVEKGRKNGPIHTTSARTHQPTAATFYALGIPSNSL